MKTSLPRPVFRGFKFRSATLLALSLGWAWGGKQRLILQLREPLRSAPAELVLPAVTNAKGETRDLKAELQLADSTLPGNTDAVDAPKAIPVDMTVRDGGGHTIWVHITLPNAAQVDITLMDIHGKNLGTLFSDQCSAGEQNQRLEVPKESDPGSIRLIAMRVNGKLAVRRAISQVK